MKQFNLVIISAVIIFMIAGCGGEEAATEHKQDDSLVPGKVSYSDWQLLNNTHGINGNAWQLEQCDACHVATDIHQNPAQASIKTIVLDKGYQTCVGCHGSNGNDSERPCLVCHNQQDLPQMPAITGIQTHNFSVNENRINDQHSGLTDKQCLDCHIASDMNGSFDINIDLTRFIDKRGKQSLYQDNSDFCLRCHNSDNQQKGFEIIGKGYQNPLIAMAINYQAIDVHGELKGKGNRTYSGLRHGYNYQAKVQCIDCHAMHGTQNEKLIVGSTAVGASKLISNQLLTSITTHEGDSSQLCVVCHQMTTVIEEGYKDTGNGLSGVHLTGQECRSCHQHGMATQTGL